MLIELRLEPPASGGGGIINDYNSDEDDVRLMLFDICNSLGAGSRFIISGFGQDQWPVDTTTDLVTYLEQLPMAIISLRNGDDFEIDFYEQGIERRISFSKIAEKYVLECFSSTEWQPDPRLEEISLPKIFNMPEDNLEDFLNYIKNYFRELSDHPWIREWITGKWNLN